MAALIVLLCIVIMSIIFMILNKSLMDNEKSSKVINLICMHHKKIIYGSILGLAVFFVIFNFFTNGKLFDEMFFKIKNDFGLDFYVFLSDSVLTKDAYTQNVVSFNPPLIKLISIFIYQSFTPDVQVLYEAGALTKGVVDIRLQIQAFLPFLILIISSVFILFFTSFYFKKGNTMEKIIFSVISIINIGAVYAIERGNYVILSYPLALLFLLTYNSKNKAIREIGLISLGICAGLKLYPCLYGIILIKDKQFKLAIRACFYGVLMIFGPFIYFNGFDGIVGFLQSLVGNSEQGALRIGTLNFTSIFSTIMKLFGYSEELIKSSLPTLQIVSRILLMIGVYSIFTTKERWKSIAIITLIMILYTGTSHTYMLAYIILPFVLFVDSRKKPSFLNVIYSLYFVLLIAILYIPSTSYIIELRGNTDRFTSLMITHEMVLVFFFILLLVDRMMRVKYWLFKTESIKKFRHFKKNINLLKEKIRIAINQA